MSSDRFAGKRLWIILLFSLFTLLFSLLGTGQELTLSEVDLNETGLRETLRSFARTGGFQILLDSTVQGSVTLKLKPGLSAQKAIELLSQLYGYQCRWEGRTALVGHEAKGAGRGEMKTRVYSLQHEPTDQIFEALEVVVPTERITFDPATRQITVTADALEDENLREIIARFDREAVSYLIDVKIAELDRKAVIEKGLLWPLPGSSAESSFRISTLKTDPLSVLDDQDLYWVLSAHQLYTEHGKASSTFVGEQYPVITSRPGEKMDLLEYKKVGVEIGVTPYTEEQGMVTLALNLEVSGLPDGEKAAGRQVAPVIKNNKLKSIRGLKDGETCVISGIDFTSRSSTREQGEGPPKDKVVCLFLTPRLVTDGLKAELKNVQVTGLGDGSAKAGLASSQLPATPEVVQLTITGQSEAVAGTELPSGEVLTEVVGLPKPSEVQTRAEEPVPERREESNAVALRVAYRVSKGDTVFSIARKYGVDPALILAENQLSASSILSIGQILRIPIRQNQLYQLQPKETLWRIAQRYGTTVEILMEINSIDDVTTLRTDQVIILPVSVDRVVNDQY
ncbi:MAG: LysM peptidoglycan-binding domain-containing protein [Firmicutes bacterium]|nr:LysM peptidoglycan-binding domain-containing protein [Bacillota bacterium]